MVFSRIFITALPIALILSSSAFAQTPASAVDENAPVTRKQLPALIKEALLKDPSILNEAVEKMQQDMEEEGLKKSKDGIVKNKTELFSDPSSPSIGAVDADVTVVEFFDYHCGYCKKALASIQTLLEKDKKVRVVFKEYPILSDESEYASRAALAVSRLAKDKYFDFHKAMFATTGSINEKLVLDEGKKLGIDPEKLKAEIANPEIKAILAKNRKLGAEIGAQGTPAIVIGESFYPGAIPYETMQKAVDDVRSGKNPTASTGKK